MPKAKFIVFYFLLFNLLLLSSEIAHLNLLNPLAFGEDSSAKGEIEVLFSPEDNCGAKILQVLIQAKRSIDVAIYSFTNRMLAQALVEAHRRGIKIRVYMDGENRRQKYSKADYLIKKGIEIRFEQGVGLMHNKFCVVDGEIVITGSFNWTVYADLRNDENLAVIKSKEIARIYQNKFEQLWKGEFVDEAIYSDESRLEKILLR